ncbi:MAG: RNA 2',3'-cyclic phosphodiesterase [Planctomycetes bacterium]|nr:RNA 2',3'-cyclic phosphodiesterase [Planctomycetota bacterium]
MRHKVRTFVAVELSPEVLSNARNLLREWRKFDAPIRWVDDGQLHLTLAFLGDVDALDLPQVCQAVTKAVEPLPPFEWHATGVGAFPALERPRTIWLGTGEGADDLVTLHEAIERCLSQLGFRGEGRRFKPHVTLGRVRGYDERLAPLVEQLRTQASLFAGVCDVTDVTVFSSELERHGPTHEPLAVAPLAGS